MPAMPGLAGVVDLYVHAGPDLLPRQQDDISLARASADAGLRAVLHRNHFTLTSERAALAQNATSFEIHGAIVLNDNVGGIDPCVVDTALRCGARWIGMPTVSAAAFRSRTHDGGDAIDALHMGGGRLVLVDEDGSLRSELRDIAEMAAKADAAIGLGYGEFAECIALCEAAAQADCKKLVLTYPDVMGLTERQIADIVACPGVYLELCAFTLHPDGITPQLSERLRHRALGWIRSFGPDRIVASSDGGMAGFPGPIELLTWMIGWLEESGLDQDAIDCMTRRNPAYLLGLEPDGRESE